MRLLVTGGSGFIGTNLVARWQTDSIQILNLDITPPLLSDHRSRWRYVDILDVEKLHQEFDRFRPTHVIHLAARTDCDEQTTVEAGYSVNTDGTANIIAAISDTPSVERVIITSTQYVCGPHHFPTSEEDYAPHTVYGQSKVIAEQLTRAAKLSCIWTLIRPVNIWGPWHLRYSREVWAVIRRGWYVHPGCAPVIRTYGYVGNILWQMQKILEAPREAVDGQTLYVGDLPIDVHDWVNGFSVRLLGRPVRVVPRTLVRSLALVGDVLSLAGVTFPITSSRFTSMTQDYLTPMDRTFELLGEPPSRLEDGIDETVRWLDEWKQNGEQAPPR